MAGRSKKNKYQQSIGDSLDLHGLTAAEAEAAITSFLIASRESGLQIVRIITGKGINSPSGQAVLKPLVETWLHYHGYQWRPAKITEGGEGAIDVEL